ncbi:uncharacterized protein LACBIDRAFT_297477 [Laccaria bicolor S238N-H82]|uniref:Predicted protein n=1 Tax=Laccaria bicolor (strain S238N-H82 / ATCC MYA-4686) TaxID=486041 RepID=B0DB98_LACBS|nr:uncharacterized protein LACBIDRAFT_297477 [Laccaria bicolor S238N-H82]EDR07952.1 predicted protein [Laccaria bicolor S238N-H82]|eukprot:XP_001881022.1 predicted protein [Laccaria bicolor S238N-H82]
MDLTQEHLNFKIKVSYKAWGSNTSWEWLETISPCVVALGDLQKMLNNTLGDDQGCNGYWDSILLLYGLLSIIQQSHDSFPYFVSSSHVTRHLLLSFKPPLRILCIRNSVVLHSPLKYCK